MAAKTERFATAYEATPVIELSAAAFPLAGGGALACLAVLSVVAVRADMKDRFENAYVNALTGNGIYQFFAAFRANRLDYQRFYRTLPDARAFSIVRRLLRTPDATYPSNDPEDITRAIRNPGPEQHLNMVLISVESLSGDYLAHFGSTRQLTLNLDVLAGQGCFLPVCMPTARV